MDFDYSPKNEIQFKIL